jgi:hypothetical protein
VATLFPLTVFLVVLRSVDLLVFGEVQLGLLLRFEF